MAQVVALTAEEQIWAAQQESTMHLISQQLLTNRGQGQPSDEKGFIELHINAQVTSSLVKKCWLFLFTQEFFLVQKFLALSRLSLHIKNKKKTQARYLVSQNLLCINSPELFVLLKALIWCNPCYQPHLLTGTPLFQPAQRLRNKANPVGTAVG